MTHTQSIELGVCQGIGLALVAATVVAIFIWVGRNNDGGPPTPTAATFVSSPVELNPIGYHRPKGATA